MNRLDRATELKEQIETLKSDINKAKGRKQELMKRLKDGFKCDSIKGAEKLIQKYNKNMVKESSKLDGLLLEIENLLPDIEEDE